MSIKLLHGDCLELLPTLPDNSVDAIVTDPPYGLSKQPDIAEVLTHWLNGDDYEHKGGGFMGKTWDSFVPSPAIWREVYRVLKPGGHMLAFFGTRTYDLGVIAIRLAGFECRDMVAWVYGSGFPKSHNISKAIGKAAGAEREVVGEYSYPDGKKRNWIKHKTKRNGRYGDIKSDDSLNDRTITAPVTDAAKQWEGWGTALKPAHEPIVLARKPFKGTVANNVLEHGTGGLNIDACRVGTSKEVPGAVKTGKPIHAPSWLKKHGHGSGFGPREMHQSGMNPNIGRWPANFIHDGSDEVLELFPETQSGTITRRRSMGFSGGQNEWQTVEHQGNSGSAARFFYCAKASKKDRDEGLEEFEAKRSGMSNGAQIHGEGYDKGQAIGLNRVIPRKNPHPTVKPTALMRYLVCLVTPPKGTVLDPFMGSGSTGKACVLEGFDFIGIEQDAEYLDIARARIEHAAKSTEAKDTPLFTDAKLEEAT